MSLLDTRLRDLNLRIVGSPLEPIVQTFLAELSRAGIALKPQLYLSTEWGVPEGSASLAIPFYLARADLLALHRERTGLIEGVGPLDVLRYLRHEMGHILDYAYKLGERAEWQRRFGDPCQSYKEEYRPRPFSREYVVHLPGWYAQKHPQEDWAETCAVCLTEGLDWRSEYRGCTGAVGKLRYCEKILKALKGRKPPRVVYDPDEDIDTLEHTLAEFYTAFGAEPPDDPPAGMPAALRAAFAPLADDGSGVTKQVADLIQASSADLCAVIYRLTGHFPDRTLPLLAILADTAATMELCYPASADREALLTLTSLVGAMAMNFTLRGHYQLSLVPTPSQVP